jgi:hypothetical protein
VHPQSPALRALAEKWETVRHALRPHRGRWFLQTLACALGACAGGPSAGAQTLAVEAAEVYVELHPTDGFLYVKEYHLSTLKQDSAAIAAQAVKIAGLVQRKSYCIARYPFTVFVSMEEKLYHDRGSITVECRLLSRERNLRTLMSDAFGRVLNRPVNVTIESGEIGLSYTGPDVQVRGNNSLGVCEKGDQRVIFWRNGTSSFEAVLGPENREVSTYRSIAPYVRADVASPEMTEAEIEAWRRGP